jgi:IS30 family transposase
VRQKLEEDYSPEKIVGDATRKGTECVSHERIYKFVWDDKKQGGKLYRHVRTKGKRYAKRGDSKGKRGQIVGRVDIEQPLSVVEEKQRVRDPEMDLVIGQGHSGVLLTINDRATGMLKMALLESKGAALVQAKAVELLAEWKPLLHTVTTDMRGGPGRKEFACHQKVADLLEVDCYFAKPYHSWERGSNENLIGSPLRRAGQAILSERNEF